MSSFMPSSMSSSKPSSSQSSSSATHIPSQPPSQKQNNQGLSDNGKDNGKNNGKNNGFPVAWVMMLGVMVALGPLSIDMYLPALPSMANSFGVSTGFIANSVPAYFIGLVFGQLFYGPWSDRIGRVKPLYFGMILFVLATLVCLHTDSPYVLFVARTVQALGACVSSVVTRASIRDKLTPKQTAKAFALMTLVMGVAPILAPSLGAVMMKFFGWQVVFWFLLGYGLLVILLTKLFFHETLDHEHRNTRPASQVLHQYWDLLKDRRFRLPAVGSGLLMGAMFVYISSASELLMDGYGLNESQFSMVFGTNAFGFIALTQVNQWLINRFRLVKLLRFGAMIQVISAIGLLGLGLTMGEQAWLPVVLISIFFCIAGLGLTQPNAAAIALAYQKHRAGMASAMQGALMFSVGIFGGLLLNLFPMNAVAKLGLTMSILMFLGVLCVWLIDPSLNLDEVE